MLRRRLLQGLFQWMVWSSVWLLHATVAYSRAGGGGGYSSGGGGSSSSSSGGSSGGGGGDFTIFDGIVMLGMIVFFVIAARKRARMLAEQTRARRAQSLASAAVLGERDPRFDLDAFKKRIERAFIKIQEAWSNQDLRDVRGFMSDGLHERFLIQLREQKALGFRNQLSDLRILEMDLCEARTLVHFDVVAVRITAMANDVRIDASTDREIEGTRRAEKFTEIWSFLRGREFGVVEDEGLFEGCCPNCAAPVDPQRIWSCESCGSQLDGAPPDWVLTEITQLAEWSNEERTESGWLKAAIERDPGLTEAQLEDRASVLFWRLMDSNRLGHAMELVGASRLLFLDRHRQRLASEPSRYVGDCAVGAVRLRGIVAGEKWDLALVEIRWSGAGFMRASKGVVTQTGTRSLSRHLLVMARRSGVESQVGRCIVSAHCARCGAPDEGALEGRCRFCDAALNDGRDWLIDRFLVMGSAEASILLAEVNRPSSGARGGVDARDDSPEPDLERICAPGAMELYAWSLTVAYADQHLDPREREGFDQLASRLGIPASKARTLRQAAQFGRLDVEPPGSDSEARAWLQVMSKMARIDGRLDRRETAALEGLARRAGVEGSAP